MLLLQYFSIRYSSTLVFGMPSSAKLTYCQLSSVLTYFYTYSDRGKLNGLHHIGYIILIPATDETKHNCVKKANYNHHIFHVLPTEHR